MCIGTHWVRAIAALGHTVRLMPPAYVKPYVKRGKTDAADAEAICEAVTRPTMRFVAIKTEEQQATLMLHKTRDLLVRQRTMLTNALRAHLAEYGIVSGVGGVGSAITALHEDQAALPMLARFALHGLVAQLRSIEVEIEKIEAEILKWHRTSEASRRLATIPGIGPITASAIAASVPRRVVVPVRSPVRGLAGTDAEVPQQWRDRTPGRDQQAGRRIPSAPPGNWRDRRLAVRSAEQSGQGLGSPAARAQATEGGRRRTGQQDRADRLGADGPRRHIRGPGGIGDGHYRGSRDVQECKGAER